MKYLLAGFLLLFITSCDSAKNEPTPDAATEEIMEEAAEEVSADPKQAEPTGPTEADWAFIKGIYAAQPRIVQAAGRNDQLFLLSFLRRQKEMVLLDKIQTILNKAPEFETYSVEILSYDEENAFIEWKTEDEFETVINQMKLYPYQYKGFEFAVRTSISNYLGPDQWRSNIYPAYFRNTIEQLEHDQVMTNKGLIAQRLKPNQSVLWGNIADEVTWKIEPKSPFIWVEYQGSSVKLVYDGSGRVVLPKSSLKGMTEKDNAFVNEFRSIFPSEVQEALSDLGRMKAYAKHMNMQRYSKGFTEIEKRLGVDVDSNWIFTIERNYCGIKKPDGSLAYGYRSYNHKPSSGDLVLQIRRSDCAVACEYQMKFFLYKQKEKLGERTPEEFIEDFRKLPKKFKEKFDGAFVDDDFQLKIGYSMIEVTFKEGKSLRLNWNGEQFVEKN